MSHLCNKFSGFRCGNYTMKHSTSTFVLFVSNLSFSYNAFFAMQED